jgi:hypothetical protein
VNLASPFTYHPYVCCLTEIRTAVRGPENETLCLLLELMLRALPIDVFSEGTGGRVCSRRPLSAISDNSAFLA